MDHSIIKSLQCNTVCFQHFDCWAKTSTLPGSPPPKYTPRHTTTGRRR